MAARTPLLVTVLVLAGSVQAGAQEHTWTIDRPDAVAPAGVFADRVLDLGQLEVALQFRQADAEGLRWGTEPFSFAEAFEFFDIVPLTQNTEAYVVDVAYGVTDELTVTARTGFTQKRREQITADDDYFVIDSDGMTDTEAAVLWKFWDEGGAVRAHLKGGVSIPTGSTDLEGGIEGIRTGVLPYDMQTGSGVFGFLPGLGVTVQNEVATVGVQAQARLHVGENDRGWSPGDALEGDVWGAYQFNRFFSVSVRLHGIAWGAIEGFDPDLVPLRDPGELPTSFGGERVDLPVGVNFYMPVGPLAGHRLGLEYVWNVHEDLEGPWIAASNGFVLSWQAVF